MLERFRGFWALLMKPGAMLLAKLGVHPDVVTLLGTVFVVIAAFVTVPNGWLWQGALLMGLLVLTDGMDGALARMSNRVSRFGAFLDSTLDRVADGAIFGAVLVWVAAQPTPGARWWALVALWALVMGQVTSYIKARAEANGYLCKGGLAARADRLVILLVAMLLTGLGVPYALHVGVAILAVVSTITVGQRLLSVRGQSAQEVV